MVRPNLIWNENAESVFSRYDGTPLGRYHGWAETEPNGGSQENCADLGQEGWRDIGCNSKKPFVCKMPASTDPSGNPVLPDGSSTMPPTTNCGYMGEKWVENPNTGMCYSLVNDKRYSWSDAREYCREIGGYREKGDLASIGSQPEQEFFNCKMALSFVSSGALRGTRLTGGRRSEVNRCSELHYWNEVEIEQGETSWLKMWILFLDLKSCHSRPSGFSFYTSNHVTKCEKKWGVL